MTIGPIRHHQGETFVQESQGVPIPLFDRKAKILAKTFDRLIDDFQIGKPGFLDESQGDQSLNNDCIMPALGELRQSLFKSVGSMDDRSAVFSP
ncbi:hypothetical protein [Desulfatibacillum aliphaticivorans]|uniref:hypothetical protein n=1 Tax=Desulfatibacillum aliphaticivorans TaxID=218208 RepID=UPI00186BBA28